MKKLTPKENKLLFEALQFYQYYSRKNLILNPIWGNLLLKCFSEKVWKRLGGMTNVVIDLPQEYPNLHIEKEK